MVALEGAYAFFDDLGKQRAVTILERYHHLVRDLAAGFSGREIELAHRFLFRFDRPFDGVQFCLALHDRLPDLCRELDLKLEARCAVHLDEVVQWESPVEDVTRGARPWVVDGPARQRITHLTSMALPRQTLITSLARDLSMRAGKKELADDILWVDHGSFVVTEGRDPIEVFEVGRKGVSSFGRPGIRENISMEMTALPWEAAEGEPLPGRRHWVLERQLDLIVPGEAWIGLQQRVRDRHLFVVATDVVGQTALRQELENLKAWRQALNEPPFLPRPIEARLSDAPYYLELDSDQSRPLMEWFTEATSEQRLNLIETLLDLAKAFHEAELVFGEVAAQRFMVNDQGLLLLVGTSQELPPPLYRAPEIEAAGKVTSASDLYAFGVLFYQLVRGDLGAGPGPFWERQLNDGKLQKLIAGLLEPEPETRLTAAAALDCLRAQEVSSPALSDPLATSEPPVNNTKFFWVGLALAFIAGLVAGGVLL